MPTDVANPTTCPVLLTSEAQPSRASERAQINHLTIAVKCDSKAASTSSQRDQRILCEPVTLWLLLAHVHSSPWNPEPRSDCRNSSKPDKTLVE